MDKPYYEREYYDSDYREPGDLPGCGFWVFVLLIMILIILLDLTLI